MACTIRAYKAPTDDPDWDRLSDMSVTAFCGGDWGSSIQLNVGSEYTVLTEQQTKDLIGTLQKRLAGDDGYTATGECDTQMVLSDGSTKDWSD